MEPDVRRHAQRSTVHHDRRAATIKPSLDKIALALSSRRDNHLLAATAKMAILIVAAFPSRLSRYIAVRSEATPIDQLAFEGGEETLAHRIVVGVADRACRRTNAGFLAAIAESDRRVLSGFKWSSQPLDGSCDEDSKTALGSFWAGALVLTRSTAGGRARGAAAILGGDCGRHGE